MAGKKRETELKLPLAISLFIFCLGAIFWAIIVYIEYKGIAKNLPITIRVLIPIIAILIISVILYIIILKYVSRPISKIISSNKEVLEHPDLGACLIERGDEIGVLSQSIKEILEKSESKLKSTKNEKDDLNNIVEDLPEPLFLLSTGEFKIIRVNNSAKELTGYPIETLLEMSLYDLCYSEDIEDCVQSMMKIIKKIENKVTFRIHRIDGFLIWVEMSACVIELSGKRLILAIVKDMSEKEKILRETSRFEDTISNLNQMVIITDKFQKINYVNESTLRTLGYETVELMGNDFKVLWSDKNPEKVLNEISSVLLRDNWSGECVIRKRNRMDLSVFLSIAQIFNKQKDDVIALGWVMWDITSQKEIRKSLQDEKDYYKKLIDTSKVMFCLFDNSKEIKFWNQGAELITGYKAEEMLGNPNALNILIPDKLYRQDVVDFFGNIEGEYEYCECRITTKDGVDKTISFLGTKWRDKDGNQIGSINVGIDITEKKRLLEDIFLKKKQEGINRLSRGIAHDFNNVLSGILGYVSYAKTLVSEDDKLHKYLDNIQISSERGKDITNQLIMFSSSETAHPINLNISLLVNEIVPEVKKDLPNGMAMKIELEDDIPTIRADSEQIRQVLIRLIENAKDAMTDKGGTITLKTETVIVGEEVAQHKKGFVPGRYILISIEDTGCGIPKENIEKIFDPFFTTKGIVSGAGLGLSVVYSIIKNHYGYIDVISEEGKGTEFKIFLPFVRGRSITTKAEKLLVQTGSETILIYDESIMVRELVVEILTELGYRVIPARDSIDLIELYKNNMPFIDLILLDIQMPTPGSLDPFFQLRELNSKVKIVITSGFGEHGAVKEALRNGALGFVQKPYVLNELSGLIKRILSKK